MAARSNARKPAHIARSERADRVRARAVHRSGCFVAGGARAHRRGLRAPQAAGLAFNALAHRVRHLQRLKLQAEILPALQQRRDAALEAAPAAARALAREAARVQGALRPAFLQRRRGAARHRRL